METIKQVIYNALSGDKQKVKLFSKKTNEARIIKMKQQVYLILAQKGFKNEEIAEEANCTRSTVYNGIRRQLGYNSLKRDVVISSSLIVKLTLGGKNGSRGALYHTLIESGVSRKEIARHFNIKPNRVKNDLVHHRKALRLEEFEKTRKKIIRFR